MTTRGEGHIDPEVLELDDDILNPTGSRVRWDEPNKEWVEVIDVTASTEYEGFAEHIAELEESQEDAVSKYRIRDRFAKKLARVPGPAIVRELLLWYSLTWPMLLIRTPLVYALHFGLGLKLWLAIVVQFAIERPVFYLVATRLVHPTAAGKNDD